MTEQSLAARQSSIGTAARDTFDQRQVGLLAALAPKGMEPFGRDKGAFNTYLELAARYELDPFARQIWLAKMGGQDGDNGSYVVMVGRDGFLSIANRAADFDGMSADCVYENDTFRIAYGGDVGTDLGDGRRLIHEVNGFADRGKLVGSWAVVYRRDRKPTHFVAPIAQYKPTSERKLKYSPWGTQEDVMMMKCAQSTALRLAYSITGLVGEEEASAKVVAESVATGGEPVDGIEWGDDLSVADWTQRCFAEANRVKSGAVLPGKMRQVMASMDDDDARVEWVEQTLVPLIVKHGGEVPERREVVEGDATEVPDDEEGGEDPWAGAVDPDAEQIPFGDEQMVRPEDQPEDDQLRVD